MALSAMQNMYAVIEIIAKIYVQRYIKMAGVCVKCQFIQ